MSISQALSSAGSGLSAASRRASVVSSNISNALTPGYARREVLTSERVVAGQGAGVQVDGVRRVQDAALTGSRRASEGESVRDEAIATIQNQISSSLGGPEDAFSFFSSFSNLESAFSTLREQPESSTLQENTLVAAEQIVNDFNRLSTEASTLRLDADREIARQVETVNDALRSIDSLNTEIRTASSSGRDTAALQDERQRLIDQVSSIIPVREIAVDGDEVNLITQEGVFLLSGSPSEVTFTPSPAIAASDTYDNGGLSGLLVEGVDITPFSTSPLSPNGGTLAAQFEIRDRIIPEYTQQLDGLAEDLIRRFSDPANDPSLATGAVGLFTDNGDPVAADPAPGLAARISVNAAVDPSQGGLLTRFRDGVGATAERAAADSTIVDAMLSGIREPRSIDAAGFSGAMSLVDAAADFSSIRASNALNAESRASVSGARTAGLVEAEQDLSGVDTDF
ncbi:MAG: flagellar hook-associated protein FlgK, partial [Pseudomonadota bacterium]